MSHAVRAGSRLLLVAVMVLLGKLHAQAQWQIQAITALSPGGGSMGAFGATPAMVFDSLNQPHVAYMLPNTSQVACNDRDGSGMAGTWAASSVGVDALAPANICMASAGGSVYLTCSEVWYTSPYFSSIIFDGTTWQRYAPSGFPPSATLGGLAANGSGQLHWIINNKTYTSGNIFALGFNLLRQTSPTTVEGILLAGGVMPSPTWSYSPEEILRTGGDMVFDAAGNLHTVQYVKLGCSGNLLYATGPADGPFTVDDNVDKGWWVKAGKPSIAVDASNKPHIVYATLWPYYRLNYLTRDGTGWKRQIIEGGGKRTGYIGTFPKVLIGASGTVHIIYADGLHGLVKHAKFVNSQWQIETIDTVGTQATYTAQTGALAAAMDSLGGIGVAYWDADNAMLKYAYLAP